MDQQLPATEITALLGRGTPVRGKAPLPEGRVRIDGVFKGEIRSDDTLVIGEGAEVHAEIDVATVIVRGGIVHGNIRAKNAIEIHSPGKMVGNLHSPSLFIDRGVEFQGSCRMDAVVMAPSPVRANCRRGPAIARRPCVRRTACVTARPHSSCLPALAELQAAAPRTPLPSAPATQCARPVNSFGNDPGRIPGLRGNGRARRRDRARHEREAARKESEGRMPDRDRPRRRRRRVRASRLRMKPARPRQGEPRRWGRGTLLAATEAVAARDRVCSASAAPYVCARERWSARRRTCGTHASGGWLGRRPSTVLVGNAGLGVSPKTKSGLHRTRRSHGMNEGHGRALRRQHGMNEGQVSARSAVSMG